MWYKIDVIRREWKREKFGVDWVSALFVCLMKKLNNIFCDVYSVFYLYIETKNVPLVYLMTHFGLFLTCDKQKKTTHIEYHVSFIKGYCRYSTSWTESGNNTICKVFLSFKHKYISNNIFEWTYFSSKSIHLTQKLAYPHNWFWYNNEL